MVAMLYDEDGADASASVGRCRLTLGLPRTSTDIRPGVYGHRFRCIRIQGQIHTDIGSYVAVWVDPVKPKLKPPGAERCETEVWMYCFQLLLSKSSFGAAPGRCCRSTTWRRRAGRWPRCAPRSRVGQAGSDRVQSGVRGGIRGLRMRSEGGVRGVYTLNPKPSPLNPIPALPAPCWYCPHHSYPITVVDIAIAVAQHVIE